MEKSNLLKSVQCTDQNAKSTDTGKLLGKKRKKIEDFGLIEKNSSTETTLKIKIEHKNVNHVIYFLYHSTY